MTPLLRSPLDYFRTTNGIRWRDTNAWQHLSDIQIDLGPRGTAVMQNLSDVQPNASVNLKAFADFYRGNTNYPQSAHPGKDADSRSHRPQQIRAGPERVARSGGNTAVLAISY